MADAASRDVEEGTAFLPRFGADGLVTCVTVDAGDGAVLMVAHMNAESLARTIESAGNDLLNLINDILDLSKIEAGHVEIRPEIVSLQRLAADLRQTFDPIASERKVGFVIELSDNVPARFTSDRQRLEPGGSRQT